MTVESDQERIIDNAAQYCFEETGDPDRSLTVDEIFDHAGFGLSSILATALAGLSMLLFGILVEYITLLCNYLECNDQLDISEIIAIKVLIIMGCVLGLPLSGLVSDKIGRTKAALMGAYVVLFSWIFSSISLTLLFITVLCIGAGFALLLPSSLIYAFENSSKFQHTRVALILFGEYILGQLLAIVLFNTTIDAIGWHWLTVILALPSLVLIIYFHQAQEPVKFMAISGRQNYAYVYLLDLHKENGVPMIQGKLKTCEITERGQCCSPCDIANLKTTILLIIINFIFSFCYFSTSYGLYISLLTTGYCGSDAILGELGCSADKKQTLVRSLLALVPDVIGLLFGLFACEVFGRKRAMFVLAGVGGLVTLTATVCIENVVTLVELGTARALIFGVLLIIWLYTLECYTTDKRCISFSYIFIFTLLAMYIAGSVTFAIRAAPLVIIIIVGVLLLSSLVPVWFLDELPETDIDNNIEERQNLRS